MQAIGLDEDLVEVDLYAFIGAKASDEKKDIKKAYKRKALEKHPDKNKDNPNAPAEFDKLKRAYAFLSDDTKREQYDKVVRARESRKRKLEEQNAGRMSMRQALERREAAARQEKANQQKASDAEKAKFQTDMMIKELMRTGKIGAPSSHTPPTPEAAVHERKKAKTSRVETPTINGSPKPPAPVHTSNTLMISWAKKKQEGTDEESLRKLLGQFGRLDVLLAKKKKAVAVFASGQEALAALAWVRQAYGEWTVELKGGTPTANEEKENTGGTTGDRGVGRQATFASAPVTPNPIAATQSSGSGADDYELQTLMRMRAAAAATRQKA